MTEATKGPAVGAQGAVHDELSLIDLGITLMRGRRTVAKVAALVSGCVAIVVLALPRMFSTSGIFVPAGSDGLASRASGLAAQFGLSLGGAGSGQTPDFYAEFLQSHSVLSAIAEDSVTIRRPSLLPWRDETVEVAALSRLMNVSEEADAVRRDKTVMKLREHIEIKVLPLPGTVTVKVRTPYADLSKHIGDRLIELVNEYNRSQRQTQARAEREFTEARLMQARMELAQSEDSLKAFLENNRSYQSSPSLRFEADRLGRAVALRQQVVSSLSDAYEVARISEVRTTPVISVVQQPIRPAVPDRRYLIVKTLVGLVLGLGLGSVIVVVRQSVSGNSIGGGSIEELWRETLSDVRRPWRLLARETS